MTDRRHPKWCALRVSDKLYGLPLTRDVQGCRVLHLDSQNLQNLLPAVQQAKADGCVSCVDLTAVDYLGDSTRTGVPLEIELQRFEVCIALISHAPPERLRFRIQISENSMELPSLFDIYPSVEVLEREVYDMFGIKFQNHPNLTRILMPENWEGFPLRKDFPTGAVPVQFKEAGS